MTVDELLRGILTDIEAFEEMLESACEALELPAEDNAFIANLVEQDMEVLLDQVEWVKTGLIEYLGKQKHGGEDA